MEKFLNKKYKFEQADEKFNDYLSGIGINFFNRKIVSSLATFTQIVKLSENEYAINTIIPFLTHQQRFVPGQETEQTTIDGRRIKNIFTIEGNKLIEKQIEPKRVVILIREYYDKEMLGQSMVGDISSKQWSRAEE